MEGLDELCTDNFTDEYKIRFYCNVMKAEFGITSLGGGFEKRGQAFAKYLAAHTTRQHSLVSAKEENGHATAVLTGKKTDLLNYSFPVYDEDLGTQCVNEHLYELLAVLQTQGEKAMEEKISEGLYGLLFEKMRTSADSAPAEDFEMEMTLKQADGRWLVSRTRPN